jgi:hypothetical protein
LAQQEESRRVFFNYYPQGISTMIKKQAARTVAQRVSFFNRTSLRRALPAAALAVVAMAATGVVQAQSTYKPDGPAATMFTPGGTYVALNAGTADLSRPITAFGLFGGNQQGQAYSVAIGNYFANQNYGLELGYTDFGKADRFGGSTKVDGINLSLIGRLPLNATFNLLGKVGTTYSRTDVSTNAANSSKAGTERGWDWSYGLGAEMLITPQWSAVLQYEEHYVKYPNANNERVSDTMLGVRYHF